MPTPDLLTAREVADRFRVSYSTVMRWKDNGTLRAYKVGGSLRFARADVERLLEPQDAA